MAADSLRGSSNSRVDGPTRRAKLAVGAVFALNGLIFANWVARVPAVKDGIQAGTGALGLALLGIAGGSLLTMPLAGRLCERIGSDRAVVATGLASGLALIGPALASSPLTLGLGLAVYGSAFGLLDVAMNVQAVAVVRQVNRPIMPWFHAGFSLGGLLGAATGALAAQAGLTPLSHFTLVGGVTAAVILLSRPHLLRDRQPGSGHAETPVDPSPVAVTVADHGDPADRTDPADAGHAPAGERRQPGGKAGRSWQRRQRRMLLAGLGVVGGCAALGEGAMADWTALFMRDVTGTGAGVAALGFAAFSVTMTVGRLGGEAAIERLGPSRVLRLGGTAVAIGVVLAVVGASPIAGLVGFALVGLGFSCAFPLALTTAGESSDAAGGREIATVSVIAYLGFLIGPPFIGLLGELVELRLAMLAVVLPALGLVALSGVVDVPSGEQALAEAGLDVGGETEVVGDVGVERAVVGS